MTNIILIADPKVIALPINDNAEPLVDLLRHPEFFIDKRKSDVSNSYTKLRVGVVERLLQVNKLLPPDIRLLMVEGHRPLSLQRQYFEEYSVELKAIHPDWSSDRLYHETSKYVAPPDIIPPHRTGGAVDLTLATANGVELDMGCRLNADPEESSGRCFTAAEDISTAAKQNRQLLIQVMTEAGFVNYPTEWWHWSYDDRYWAFLTHQKNAIYGATN